MNRSKKVRSGIVALIGTAMLLLVGVQSAAALEITNGGWSDYVGGAPGPVDPRADAVATKIETSRSTTLPSGVVVAVAVSGANVSMVAANEPMTQRGGTTNLFAEPAIADAIGVLIATEVQGCAYGSQTDTLCEGRGVVRIEFSQPVTNPVLSIAGLGAGADETRNSKIVAQTVVWTELTSLTPGITMRPIGSATNLALTNGGTRIAPIVANPASSCTDKLGNKGSTAYAVCGSLELIGTSKFFEFGVTLGAHNVVATCFDARCGLYRDEWSLVLSVDKDAKSPPEDAPPTDTGRSSSDAGPVVAIIAVIAGILVVVSIAILNRLRSG